MKGGNSEGKEITNIAGKFGEVLSNEIRKMMEWKKFTFQKNECSTVSL